jgi:hypothetical protein
VVAQGAAAHVALWHDERLVGRAQSRRHERDLHGLGELDQDVARLDVAVEGDHGRVLRVVARRRHAVRRRPRLRARPDRRRRVRAVEDRGRRDDRRLAGRGERRRREERRRDGQLVAGASNERAEAVREALDLRAAAARLAQVVDDPEPAPVAPLARRRDALVAGLPAMLVARVALAVQQVPLAAAADDPDVRRRPARELAPEGEEARLRARQVRPAEPPE